MANYQKGQALQLQEELLILSLQSYLEMQQARQGEYINTLRSIEWVAEETKNVAANTNVVAYQSGEKLDRIEGKLKNINGQLVKAEDTSKQITSFWYYLKKKVKGAFGFKTVYPNMESSTSTQTKQDVHKMQPNIEGQISVQQGSNEDEIMDSILSNLGHIKKYGKDLGVEIDRQNKIIERIDPQMDKAINKMGKVNKILKKELS